MSVASVEINLTSVVPCHRNAVAQVALQTLQYAQELSLQTNTARLAQLQASLLSTATTVTAEFQTLFNQYQNLDVALTSSMFCVIRSSLSSNLFVAHTHIIYHSTFEEYVTQPSGPPTQVITTSQLKDVVLHILSDAFVK